MCILLKSYILELPVELLFFGLFCPKDFQNKPQCRLKINLISEQQKLHQHCKCLMRLLHFLGLPENRIFLNFNITLQVIFLKADITMKAYTFANISITKAIGSEIEVVVVVEHITFYRSCYLNFKRTKLMVFSSQFKTDKTFLLKRSNLSHRLEHSFLSRSKTF